MGEIRILDCTLRDGGYINDWNFGKDAINFIIQQLDESRLDFIEVGFIGNCEFDEDRTMFPSVASVETLLSKIERHNSRFVGMIDMNDAIPIDDIPPHRDGGLDAIRVIFKQDRIKEGFDYVSAVIKKGYITMVQLVSTDTYSDYELVDAIRMFNRLKPFAIYIVDTLGLMEKKDFMRMVYLMDHNMDEDIALGYHSHNNLQQARGNAEAFVEAGLDRDILIDACVFGMGRGAGNLNEELFAGYMNDYYSKNYKIEPMLEIIDNYLNDIYREHYWGYSLHYYLSAKNGVHPNYAKYYNQIGGLSERAFDELLKTIKDEDSHVFNPMKAQNYYERFIERYIDDTQSINSLREIISDKNVTIAIGDTNDAGDGFAIRLNHKGQIQYFDDPDMYDDRDPNGLALVTSDVKKNADKDELIFNHTSYQPFVSDRRYGSLFRLIGILRKCGCSDIRIIDDGEMPRDVRKVFDKEIPKMGVTVHE